MLFIYYLAFFSGFVSGACIQIRSGTHNLSS